MLHHRRSVTIRSVIRGQFVPCGYITYGVELQSLIGRHVRRLREIQEPGWRKPVKTLRTSVRIAFSYAEVRIELLDFRRKSDKLREANSDQFIVIRLKNVRAFRNILNCKHSNAVNWRWSKSRIHSLV